MTEKFNKISIWIEIILFLVLMSTIIFFGVQKITKDSKIQNFITSQKVNLLSKKLSDVDRSKKFNVYLFSGDGCPHCADEKKILEKIKSKYPGMKVQEYEVYNNKENYKLLSKVLDEKKIPFEGVPVTFVNDKYYLGYDDVLGLKIEETILEALTGTYKDKTGKLIGLQALSTEQSWVYKKQQDSSLKKK
jgi:glutaredoxin